MTKVRWLLCSLLGRNFVFYSFDPREEEKKE